MYRILIVPLALVCSGELAIACGGSGGGVRSTGGFTDRSFSGGARIVGAPMVSPLFAQTAQWNRARQAAAMQASAYNARMRPLRLARANRLRQEKLAARQARAEVRIAKLEAKRRDQQTFLASARTWTDASGNHQVKAILADANDWGVRLKKEDGSFVNVPHERLSSSDQLWIASVRERDRDEDQLMLASL